MRSTVKLISGCFFQESFAIDFTDRSDAADTLVDDSGSNNNEDFAGKDFFYFTIDYWENQ